MANVRLFSICLLVLYYEKSEIPILLFKPTVCGIVVKSIMNILTL